MLDHLTGGRLETGVVSGISPLVRPHAAQRRVDAAVGCLARPTANLRLQPTALVEPPAPAVGFRRLQPEVRSERRLEPEVG